MNEILDIKLVQLYSMSIIRRQNNAKNNNVVLYKVQMYNVY